MKLAICIPVYGDTKAKFTQCLADMISHIHTANLLDPDGNKVTVDCKVIMVSCSMLTESRHKLVAEAMMWGADYMLWMDADHIFPPDTFARLWARGVPVVGCNYARRSIPTAPTASRWDEDQDKAELVYTTEEKANANEIEEVAHLGFGVCLIDMRVFDVLQADAEARGEKSMLPLFKFGTKDNGIGVIGEDVFFFKKLRDAGIKVFCDHGLSWEVGHISEMIFTNAHALVQRQGWNDAAEQMRERFEQRARELDHDDLEHRSTR